MGFYLLVLSVAVMASVPSGQASSVVSRCRAQCREEAELKRQCSLELNCDRFLPDWTMFMDCRRPCRDVGNNCFERCAYKTDEITARCLGHCGIDEVNTEEGPLALGDVYSNDIASNQEGNAESGTLCYWRCYENQLNEAIDRLYTKRPPH